MLSILNQLLLCVRYKWENGLTGIQEHWLNVVGMKGLDMSVFEIVFEIIS